MPDFIQHDPQRPIRCTPPMAFQFSGSVRSTDRCSHCSRRTSALNGRRGYQGSDAYFGLREGLGCTCGPVTWTEEDVRAHNTYVAAEVAWTASQPRGDGDDSCDESEDEYCQCCDHDPCICNTDPGDSACNCPSCTTALAEQLGRERAEHVRYRNQRRAEGMSSSESHRWSPTRMLRWTQSTALRGRERLGLEFECDARNAEHKESMIRRANEAFRQLGMNHADGYMIAKRDGSVEGNFPIEFATVPCTVAEHAAVMRMAFQHGRFGDGVIRSWDNPTCGLHVHISRRRLTPLTVGKLAVFWHHPDNSEFLTELAGRPANGYCRRPPTFVGDAAILGRGDRYCALNFVNIHTVEVRAFRPSPRIELISKNLEVVESCASFARGAAICATTGHDAGPMSWRSFLRFLSEAGVRKAFPDLHRWMLGRSGQHGDYYRSILPANVRRRQDGSNGSEG